MLQSAILTKLFSFLTPSLLYGTKLIADAVFPARCIQCGRHVHTVHTLCSYCWQRVPFFFPPWCEKCGLPLRYADASENEHLCLSCLRYPKPFYLARSVFGYADHSHRLILRMKNRDSLHASHALANWIARIITTTIADLPPQMQGFNAIPIVPVPTSSRKLRERRHYPTAILARLTTNKLGKPYVFAPDLLERTIDNSQRGKKATNRIHTVRNAYRVCPSFSNFLAEHPLVILVDDVMTTGATASICSQKLQQAGVQHVLIITAARVPQILPRYPRWLSSI